MRVAGAVAMPLHPTWDEIAVRLALTLAAAAVIGLNRGLRGQAAGFRTTILVGLAASVAMIQANVLLDVSGRTPQSFGTMDLMRLPLGILTGVGFIGGGAILKRGDLVTGVTTAATLWVVTVIGLCFGGGQLVLGIVATVLSVVTLWALKLIDIRIPRQHRATLVVKTREIEQTRSRVIELAAASGYRAEFRSQHRLADDATRLTFEIRWTRAEIAGPPLDLVELVEQSYPVSAFELTSELGHGE